MPSNKNPPKCVQCEKTESALWRNLDLGVFCQECYEKNEEKIEIGKVEDGAEGEGKTKKTRSQRAGNKAASNASNPKGKGRRCIFKRQPFKTPTTTATTTTRDYVFHDGMYMQKGDIVSLEDENDDVYYAQIRAFLVDTYLEKSAFLTWLIPTHLSPPPNQKFDPCTYLVSAEEDFPRKLDTMKFVCQCPSDYFMIRNSPYSIKNKSDGEQNFIWATLDQ